MSKRRLLPPGNEDYLDRMGLTEQDKKVYIAVLDSGLVNVGEICQLTQYSLSETLESVRDLTDLGLIKQGHGRMPRYYASLPFFKETVTIERETIYALDSMIHSLNQTKDEVTSEEDDVRKTAFTSMMNKFLDSVYDALIADMIQNSENMVKAVNAGKDEFQNGIKSEKEAVINELKHLIDSLKALVELSDQRLELTTMKEGGKLDQYVLDRKSARNALLKNAHSQLGTQIESIKSSLNEFSNQVNNSLSKIETISSNLKSNSGKIIEMSGSFTEQVDKISQTKDNLLAETVVVRQRLMDMAAQGKITPEAIQSEFEQLNEIIRQTSIDKDQISYYIGELSNLTSSVISQTDDLTSQVRESLDSSKDTAEAGVEGISKTLADTLNEINTNDDATLKQLQGDLSTAVNEFQNIIKKETEELRDKVKLGSNEMEGTLSQVVDHWEDRLLNFFEQPLDIVAPFLLNWRDELKPKLDEFRTDSAKLLEDELMKPLHELENKVFATVIKRVQYIKAMIEGRAQDLQSIINHSQTFDYTKSADTSVVVGIPSIYSTLVDFIIRTKNRVTVVTPRLNRELIETAEKLRPSTRVTFVTDVDPELDKKLVNRLKADGRMTLRKYSEKDLYACIRDSEEIIFGYEREGEEIIGIRSSTPSIIGLLEDRLNETVIRNSKQI